MNSANYQSVAHPVGQSLNIARCGVLGLLALATASQPVRAQETLKVGINFVGGSTKNGIPTALNFYNDYAGAILQRFWNNANGAAGTITGLEGDAGGSISVYSSGFSVHWSGGNGTGSTPIADTGGNNRFMKGCLNAGAPGNGAVTVALSNLPQRLWSNGYGVLVYFDGDNGSTGRVTKLTLTTPALASQTLFGRDAANADYAGSFQQVNGFSTNDAGSATPAGNYAVFGPLTASGFTLTISGGSTDSGPAYGAVTGIQIVSAAVLNFAPSIRLTSSTAGIWACAPVSLTAEAISYGGTINSVELLQGALRIGQSAQAPGLFNWRTNLPGAYTFTARATDSRGLVGTSAPVVVTVMPPPLHTLVPFAVSNACALCMVGETNRTYSVLATMDFLAWTNLGTMSKTNGILQFRDSPPTALPRRFYRARQE